MKLHPIVALAVVAGAVAFGGGSLAHTSPALAATPPPPPPTLPAITPQPYSSATSMPTATPTPPPVGATIVLPSGRRGKMPRATPSPPPNNRYGIDGVWEIQIQQGTQVTYAHFKLKQDENALTGVYLDPNNKQYPLAGSLNDKNVRIVVSLKDGSSINFTGELDGTTDMLGMMTTANNEIPFTASYRPKENFLENVNAGPMMGTGLGTPP